MKQTMCLEYLNSSANSLARARASEGWQNITKYARTYYPEWNSTLNSTGVKFIPNAYPGYNNTEHCNYTPTCSTPTILPLNSEMFYEMLNITLNNVDNKLKMAMITSWNEWLESTAIEPSMENGEQFLHQIYLIPEFPSQLLPIIGIVTALLLTLKWRKKLSIRKFT